MTIFETHFTHIDKVIFCSLSTFTHAGMMDGEIIRGATTFVESNYLLIIVISHTIRKQCKQLIRVLH